MNFELNNVLSDIEVLREKIDDVMTSLTRFDEEYFTRDPKHVLNKDEISAHGYRYREHRIQNTQTIDLMYMYLKEFNEVIERFKEIEKTLPDNNSLATESDNA